MPMQSASATGFEGVDAENPVLFGIAIKGAKLAQSVLEIENADVAPWMRAAEVATVGAATTLLAVSGAKCTVVSPPSDVDVISEPPPTRRMIMQCRHNPRHKWLLDGTPI